MIALLVGHCPRGPGNTAYGLIYPEYHFNRRVATAVRQQWSKHKFFHGLALDAVDAVSSNHSITERIRMAKAAQVRYAVEIHHNKDKPTAALDYALCLHHRDDTEGKLLAERIRDRLFGFMRLYGVGRWEIDALPSEDWGKKGAIEDAWPAYSPVILEPLFMNFGPTRRYFR